MADRVLRTEAPGGVRQDRQFLQVEEVEQALAVLVEQPFASDGHGGHFAPARRHALPHERVTGVLPGPGEQPRPKREPADRQRLVQLRLPPAHEGHNLDHVPVLQHRHRMQPARHHLPVHLNGQLRRVARQLPQQVRHGERVKEAARLIVNRQLRHRQNPSLNSRRTGDVSRRVVFHPRVVVHLVRQSTRRLTSPVHLEQ